ncbi:MAG: hypothetical protein ACJ8E2_10215, partial [Bradyrhizobium sp.]
SLSAGLAAAVIMAGFVPAIHALPTHEERGCSGMTRLAPFALIPTPAVDTVPRDSTPRESPI